MLLQALNEFYKRATREKLIQEAAFTEKYIRWNIPLKPNGSLEGIGLTENPEIKKDGRAFSIPKTNRPKNAGGVSEFLWDGIEAVFNLKPDLESAEPDEKKRQRQDDNRQAKFDDFWRQIEQSAEETKSPLLNAVLQFRENFTSQDKPEFLRWGSLKEDENSCWLVKTASGTEEKFKADNFTFQVNGEFLFENEELRNFWRKTFDEEKSLSEGESETGICLVSGETDVPISASHLPKISGVPGTVATGASLISFDKDSFCSYGIGKSYNSPVSFAAVEGYTNALNYLVSNKRHYLKVGNTKIIFWANKSEEATDFLAELFEQPDEFAIQKFLANAKNGIFNFKIDYDSRIYSVILGGNAGRVVVRDWLQIPLKEFIDNVANWYKDLEIIKYRSHEKDKMPPLHHYRLTASTVREVKNLQDEVSAQILRGLFHGHTPSYSIIGNLVNRFYADLTTEGKSSLGNLSRFALLRLIVNRNLRKEKKSMEIKPKLEESLVDPDLVVDYPYQCGRLLAVFEELQTVYHEYKLEGPSVVERYYGTASTSPNSAFAILWRLHTHHLRKVGRTNGDKGKAKAQAIKNKIALITKHFKRKNQADLTSPPEFPYSFNLKEQGRFALGFYQQIAADKEARDAYFKNKDMEENQQNSSEGEKENQ